jgi:phage baseplate assembly protein W
MSAKFLGVGWGFPVIWEGCDLRLMIPPYDKTEKEIIDNFKIEFESKKKKCAVLIVRATSDSEKWTIAGFSDAGEFRAVDPSHELSQELKKEPINKSRIVELALSSLGCTLWEGAEKERRFAIAEYEDSVRQAIRIILGTAKGERVMRPDFGCGIHDLVFAVNDSATRGLAEYEVREALLRWEPRIEVLQVKASASGMQGEQLLISVDYRVRATDNRFNLVYPFYLERGAH